MLSFLDQRTASELDDRSWNYGYNATGEVTRAAKTLTSTGASLEGRNYRYNFDGIGNRTSIQTGGDSTATNLRTATYTPNALNQYTAITQPGFLEIYGKAPVAQAVTVNALATTRQGRDFRKELTFPNTNQRWESITTNGGSVSTSQHHLPAASTTPGYDLDGNLTSDGQWIFAWDAENRLTSATRSPTATSAGAPYRLITYRYDSQSRQFSRSIATTPGGTPTGTLYLHDGWNVIAEYAGTTLAKTYLWGLDLSGTPQGAGGVGGLLSISDMATATTHYPCYDGNGNVRKLLNATTLVTTATYDYGPFGELVRATGPYALSNSYRFSTKPQDSDTKLYYYGYRYYDPLTGRWPSRDPINDRGFWVTAGKTEHLKGLITENLVGRLKDAENRPSQIAVQRQLKAWIEEKVESSQMAENLGMMESIDYSFVENDPINSIDKFGLDRERQGFPHGFLVLEDWQDAGGKWVSQGATEWNFGPANALLSVRSVALFAPVPGFVWQTSGGFEAPVKTTPCQDIVAKAHLAQAEANPPWYNFWSFNCHHFADVHVGWGLTDPFYKKGRCCNPDGTVWKR